MEIVDIQNKKVDTEKKVEITFADSSLNDVMTIVLSIEDMKQLQRFYRDNLSLSAQNKNKF